LVFGRKQEPPRTHRQRMIDELTESYSHLKLAAGHVAGGTAEKLTPTFDRAQGMANRGLSTTRGAFTPLYEQVLEGAANARREREVHKRKRWPVLVGLLAAGAAVGAAGAVVARRRRAAAQWDEYDPMPPVGGTTYGTESSMGHKVSAGAASVADSVSAQAGKLADSLHERSGQPKDPSRPTGIAGMNDKPEAKGNSESKDKGPLKPPGSAE
jgi:hypothetical protein